MIKISKSLQTEIISLARAASPIEACGYQAGVPGEAREVIPMQNVDQSPEHFSFDPVEQFRALKKVRNQGLQLIAVYHSHPASPARMSEEDIRLANDPDMVYVIVSLLGPEPQIRGFQVVARQVIEVPVIDGEGDDLDE